MRKAFKTSGLMGLFAIVVGLMAFSATAAQAEPGAYWQVVDKEGKITKLESGSILLPEIQAKAETEGILLTKVGVSKVEILCTEIKFVGAKLHELGRATGQIHFQSPTGCITKLNGTAAAKCVPKSPGAASGLIETNPLDGLLKLHILKNEKGEEIGKDDLFELLATPKEGVAQPFVDLILGTGECAIGNLIEITGTLFLKDCQGNTSALEDKVEHLFEEGPLSKLLFGGNAATIDGSAFGFLAGAHAGMKFSGHPA